MVPRLECLAIERDTYEARDVASIQLHLHDSQLNELLLLLGFDRVTHQFFQFLVDGTTEYREGASFKSFAQLDRAIRRFREIALLRFGNVKFAFKVFSRDTDELEAEVVRLKPVSPRRFWSRNDAISPIRLIPASETYYLGYMIERELKRRLEDDPEDADARMEEQQRQATVEIGKQNLSHVVMAPLLVPDFGARIDGYRYTGCAERMYSASELLLSHNSLPFANDHELIGFDCRHLFRCPVRPANHQVGGGSGAEPEVQAAIVR